MQTKTINFYFGVFYFHYLVASQKTCSKSDSVPGLEAGTRLTGSTYMTVTCPRVLECVTSCFRQSRCQSFNYQASNGQCELNDSNATLSVSVHLKTLPDWTHVGITDWSRNISGACADKPCGENGLCHINGTGYSCQKVELCFDLATSYYHGPVNVTETGRTCQRWDQNVPHNPAVFPDDLPSGDPALSLHDNHCRPVRHNVPWCYTMDPDKRWEDCYVPLC